MDSFVGFVFVVCGVIASICAMHLFLAVKSATDTQPRILIAFPTYSALELTGLVGFIFLTTGLAWYFSHLLPFSLGAALIPAYIALNWLVYGIGMVLGAYKDEE